MDAATEGWAMDFLKQQFDRIQDQLKGLSASQRMLTDCLVAIMVLTVMWWGRWAGEAELEPILNQTFTEAEVSQITAQLAGKGIKYRVAGDKILVPADRKFEVLADLGYARLLPQDTKAGFDEIVKNMSPWDPHSKTEMWMNRAKESTLAQVIRRWPNVQNADVMIDPTTKRMIDGSIQPSAVVNVTMNRGVKPDKHLIHAAADIVTGAQAGISRGNIKVVIDGVSYDAGDKNKPLAQSGEIVELIQMHERHYSQKIAEQLSFIRGVMVSVTVDLNVKTRHERERVVDPKNVVQKETETSSRTDETNSEPAPVGEPGALPNVSLDVGGGGGQTQTATVDENKTKFMVDHGVKEIETQTPAGSATVVGASVRVPRSFFVQIYRSANPAMTKEPDELLLAPLIDAEMTKIKQHVMACTGLSNPDSVKADPYFDVMPMMAVGEAALATAGGAGGTPGTITAILGTHTKEIAIGLLAVVSLFMVSMMVRKGTPQVAIVAPPPLKETPQLGANEEVAGEVGEIDPMLDGMELDEDAIKAQQMLDQVSTMVKENPDGAANLVKRWLNRS
ncbi:MAG: flagellar M-ring protein FliF C-terminal domain-containing protein [Tepidisphaeraceae bacterium]